MKKIGIILALCAFVCACTHKGATTVTVFVHNRIDTDRRTEMVEIPVDQLSKITLAEGQTYVVGNKAGEIVPSQVTHDGLLVFQSGINGVGTGEFTVGAGQPQEFESLVSGWFSPERLDDYVWENRQVAFRIYGNALIEKDGPSNGIDALYKRSEDMVIGKWYEDFFKSGSNYHDDHGTGLDNYDVKRTLGAGGMAPYVDGNLILNANFKGHETLDNGPLRVSFRLDYPEIEIAGAKYAESRTFTLDAGSQMTKVSQWYNTNKSMTVAVGFPFHAAEVKYTADDFVLMIEEPANNKAQGVYLGAVLPTGIGETVEYTHEVAKGMKGAGKYTQVLALTTFNGHPVKYYTGFGWEKWGDWTALSFSAYLHDFTAGLESPLTIVVQE